jgi:hypothetical protein
MAQEQSEKLKETIESSPIVYRVLENVASEDVKTLDKDPIVIFLRTCSGDSSVNQSTLQTTLCDITLRISGSPTLTKEACSLRVSYIIFN